MSGSSSSVNRSNDPWFVPDLSNIDANTSILPGNAGSDVTFSSKCEIFSQKCEAFYEDNKTTIYLALSIIALLGTLLIGFVGLPHFDPYTIGWSVMVGTMGCLSLLSGGFFVVAAKNYLLKVFAEEVAHALSNP